MTRKIRWMALLAFAASVIAGSYALAQETSAERRCFHEGEFHPAGTVLEIDGESMQCNGETGAWVPAAAAE